jgi:hypothetical protein
VYTEHRRSENLGAEGYHDILTGFLKYMQMDKGICPPPHMIPVLSNFTVLKTCMTAYEHCTEMYIANKAL